MTTTEATQLLQVLSLRDEAAQQEVSSPSSSCSLASILPYLLPFCGSRQLDILGLLDHECKELCEEEWRLRVLEKFGPLRFPTAQWRKCFKLRSYLQRRVVDNVSARVYLMNAQGTTTCFSVGIGKTMMCSRERAIVYNRCERMFDLSLRINRSIQEISALIGMVSVDEARGLLNEHINLMASVASLRSSLMFESELFQVFPAPVLLDTNTLLRGTHSFDVGDDFLNATATVMMQVWASIDGMIYRPLAPPSVLANPDDTSTQDEESQQPDEPEVAPVDYQTIKLHDLSGMTIHIDDNTLRYRIRDREMCMNALVSNTYLLYLFNPLQFRPMDWTFDAVVYVGDRRYELPTQREGVFLNGNTMALRVFLSYGKIPENTSEDSATDEEVGRATPNNGNRGTRGAEESDPLEIPYNGETELFLFRLTATNRITRETKEVVHKTACFSLNQGVETAVAPVPASSVELPALEEGKSNEQHASRRSHPLAIERHVHLPWDAMICYCFNERFTLQYVECAIGFEALMHQLEVSDFLAVAT
ncbi:hypothetical protein Poli38472_007752 [Pythium oligandrum]|uniref:Uncharacterized protein n=1 Tax=Pythium oligandrum TaxID=41045 RepID=A0A8K1CR95_PYTOL|nr:hypothetical protein Poli38472_007752 [Pythium oligandrum]|eukprot:TMW68080.1 hypothetical protein Poli38472_007752 [Pythium oligandrum]